MALSDARMGEIAVKVLTRKLLQDGTHMSPKGNRREALDGAKALGIPVGEMAEFLLCGLTILFAETRSELGSLTQNPPREKK